MRLTSTIGAPLVSGGLLAPRHPWPARVEVHGAGQEAAPRGGVILELNSAAALLEQQPNQAVDSHRPPTRLGVRNADRVAHYYVPAASDLNLQP